MRKTLVFIQLFVSIVAFSQNAEEKNTSKTDYNTQLVGHYDKGGMWLPAKSLDKEVQGSVYLFTNWIGQYKVITKKGDSRQLFNLNYNLKSKMLESSVSKDSVFQYDLDQFDYIIDGAKKYKVINDSELTGLFLEVYNGQKIKLFKETTVGIKEGVFNPLTQTVMEKDKYVQQFSYYLFLNGKYEKIKLNKSTVLKSLGDKKELVKAYVSKNSFSYSSEDDLKAILNYYNSI